MEDRFWKQLRSTPEGVEATDREIETARDELEREIKKAQTTGDLGAMATETELT